MAELIYHGHSTWEVQGDSHRILFDPFLAGNNPMADVGPDDFEKLDAVLITHAHPDHISDVEAVAKKSGALVVANFEICNHFSALGCETHPLQIGADKAFDFGHVRATIAHHSSSGPNGEYMGNPAGLILTIDGKKIYNMGDTGIFMDMKLITELYGPFEVALVPIGNVFTMGIDDAVKAAEFVKAGLYIAQHFNTFPLIEVDVQDWLGKMQATGHNAAVMEPGQGHKIA